jgi:hypothetical protein
MYANGEGRVEQGRNEGTKGLGHLKRQNSKCKIGEGIAKCGQGEMFAALCRDAATGSRALIGSRRREKALTSGFFAQVIAERFESRHLDSYGKGFFGMRR